MNEKLTGYKKKMAMLGQKMIEEEYRNELKNSVERDKLTENKSVNNEFK